jgi:hypothetical protein
VRCDAVPSCIDKRTGVKSVTPGVSNLSPQTATIREPHGMCPASVLLDGELSDKAARVYGIMALRAFGKSKVALSYSELAIGLHSSERAAMRAVSELVARGHVDVLRTHNHPNAYVLRSTVFSGPAAPCRPKSVMSPPLSTLGAIRGLPQLQSRRRTGRPG